MVVTRKNVTDTKLQEMPGGTACRRREAIEIDRYGSRSSASSNVSTTTRSSERTIISSRWPRDTRPGTSEAMTSRRGRLGLRRIAKDRCTYAAPSSIRPGQRAGSVSRRRRRREVPRAPARAVAVADLRSGNQRHIRRRYRERDRDGAGVTCHIQRAQAGIVSQKHTATQKQATRARREEADPADAGSAWGRT